MGHKGSKLVTATARNYPARRADAAPEPASSEQEPPHQMAGEGLPTAGLDAKQGPDAEAEDKDSASITLMNQLVGRVTGRRIDISAPGEKPVRTSAAAKESDLARRMTLAELRQYLHAHSPAGTAEQREAMHTLVTRRQVDPALLQDLRTSFRLPPQAEGNQGQSGQGSHGFEHGTSNWA